jgi:hypothetical protein
VSGAFAGFNVDISELEQYSTILGEGRHFRKAILDGTIVDEDGEVCMPKTFYQESDAIVWKLVQQECPNYFTRDGKPNREAKKLFSLLKEDLVGLIDDYAEVPLVDEFVNSESGDVFEEGSWDGETPIIYVEVDLLEKALTVRGSLRVTAARVLDRLGFSKHISGGERLTSSETDELLKMVYTSKWPDGRIELAQQIIFFVTAKNSIPFEEREKQQLTLASEKSKEVIEKIKSGETKQINRTTDPAEHTSDAGLDTEAIESATIIKEIQENPYKRDLFMMLTNAEQVGNTRVAQLLLPYFEHADIPMDETTFTNIVREVRVLQQQPEAHRSVTMMEQGSCSQEVEPYWNEEIGGYSKLCRKPLPCSVHSISGE